MDFLLLVAGVVGLVWGAALFRAGGLLLGAVLVLLAGICFGHPFFNLPLGPVPVTIDRLLLALLLVLALVYRRWGWTRPHPAVKADWALVAFILVLIVSTFTHDWTVNKYQPVAQLLFLYLMPLVLYWIVRQAKLSERGVWALFASLAAFGVYLSLTAVAEAQGAWSLVFPKYISSPTYIEFYGRGRGPLLNPVGTGILLGLGLFAACMLWPRLERRGKLLLLAGLPVFACGIFCTFTRSVWMGAALGGLIVVVLTLPSVWRVPVVGGLLLVSVPLVAAQWQSLLVFKRDKNVSAGDMEESARLRPILALVAWNMFQDHPWFGCGYRQYTQEFQPYLADRSTDLPLEKARPYVQHNVFLSLLTETGLAGMGLFVAMLCLWLRHAWQLWRSAAAPLAYRLVGLLMLAFVGVWLPNGLFHDVSVIPMLNMVLWFLAGLTMNLSLATSAVPATSVSLPRWPFAAAAPAR